MENIKLKAFAKINLGLEVLHKRHDGFHEINTVFTRINLADVIQISPGAELSVVCHPDIGIPQDENIVYKTASKIQKDFNLTGKNAEITIYKNIPSGAGLGGGSSDAATTLLGLNIFWDLRASRNYLFSTAADLGSDVPFFLLSNSAYSKGRGEILEEFNYILPYWILLVYPNINISTKWAYQSLDRDNTLRFGTDYKSLLPDTISHPQLLRKHFKNDFEEIVFSAYPEIAAVKEKIYETDAIFSLMSGSGSSVYGLFDSKEHADKAAEKFKQYRTFICPPMNNNLSGSLE